MRFDNWTLTKPEFSGAVFTVIVTFTRENFVILIYFWDLITEPWLNQSSLGQSLQPSLLSPERSCDIDIFMRFDNWTLTKPGLSGAVFRVVVTFTWKKIVILIFFEIWQLNLDHTTFLCGSLYSHRHFGQEKNICDIDILMRFDNWILTKPAFSGAVFYSHLRFHQIEYCDIDIFLRFWKLHLDQTRVLWGSFYSHRHFRQKKVAVLVFTWFDNWTLTKPEFSGAVFTFIGAFTRRKNLWYCFFFAIW